MNWEQANRILDERRDKALLGGGEAKIEKQHNSGQADGQGTVGAVV